MQILNSKPTTLSDWQNAFDVDLASYGRGLDEGFYRLGLEMIGEQLDGSYIDVVLCTYGMSDDSPVSEVEIMAFDPMTGAMGETHVAKGYPAVRGTFVVLKRRVEDFVSRDHNKVVKNILNAAKETEV